MQVIGCWAIVTALLVQPRATRRTAIGVLLQADDERRIDSGEQSSGLAFSSEVLCVRGDRASAVTAGGGPYSVARFSM